MTELVDEDNGGGREAHTQEKPCNDGVWKPEEEVRDGCYIFVDITITKPSHSNFVYENVCHDHYGIINIV